MISRIYIDIASIMELRLSVLSMLMGKDKAVEHCGSLDYAFREFDRFPVDMKEYQRLLSQETADAIGGSVVTYMAISLLSKLDTLEKRNAFNQQPSRSEVIVNIYPYHLSEKQAEAFVRALFVKLNESTEVTLVRDPVETWSPAYMKMLNVYAFYGYKFGEWMQAHGNSLESVGRVETKMYFAALGEADPSKEEVALFKKLGFKDIFSYTEYVMTPRMELTFLSPLLYTNIVTATAYMENNKFKMERPLEEVAKEKDHGDLVKQG